MNDLNKTRRIEVLEKKISAMIAGYGHNLRTYTDYQKEIFNNMKNELEELKNRPSDSLEELRESVARHKGFVPVTKRLFNESYESVPIIHINNSLWAMGVYVTGDLHYIFGVKNGRYWGCLCNLKFAINNF